MNFFAKMAADLDTNPKIRKCGREDRRAARDVFLFVLRRNALDQAPGSIPVSNVDPWYLADQLDMPEIDAERGLAACVRVELLEVTDDEVTIVGWDDDWSKRPLSAAERQQKRRARDMSRDVTAVTPGHESHECHGSEEMRSEEEETKPEGERAGARAIPHTAELPQGWAPEPSDENTLAALEASRIGVVVDLELKKLHEYHRSRGTKRADWNAAWRKWLLDAKPTNLAIRDAVVSIERGKTARAARDRERADREEQSRSAAADREVVQRIAQEAIKNGFRREADQETATGED